MSAPRASRAVPFTQAEVRRAIKGAEAAGKQVVGTRFSRGSGFELIFAGAEAESPESALDGWLEKRRARKA